MHRCHGCKAEGYISQAGGREDQGNFLEDTMPAGSLEVWELATRVKRAKWRAAQGQKVRKAWLVAVWCS